MTSFLFDVTREHDDIILITSQESMMTSFLFDVILIVSVRNKNDIIMCSERLVVKNNEFEGAQSRSQFGSGNEAK